MPRGGAHILLKAHAFASATRGEEFMKNRCAEGAIACVGAVIGAGFASGREIMTFFTRYGPHSWWLILLSAATMALLCALCMREASKSGTLSWCALYQECGKAVRLGSQLCVTLLMAITGGAMVSASGHMVALVWPSEWAYPIGAVGTLTLAWILGFGTMKPLTVVSGVLTAVFMLAVLMVLACEPPAERTVSLAAPVSFGEAAWAAVRAVAYAAMNLTIAIGVICKGSRRSQRGVCRLSAGFGMVLVGMLFVSNYLYAKHPELTDEAFPMVRLLSGFGRAGFLASVLLMYLAIFTTLIAIVYTLRNAVDAHVKSPALSAIVTMGLPLAISTVGFSEIVGSLYAPAGLCCLALVFAPLWVVRMRAGRQKSP